MLVEQIWDEWLAFFDSDAKTKYRYSDDDQDGWFAPDVSETAKGNSVKDLKEFFHVYPGASTRSRSPTQHFATP